jgi:hypothetical protein
MASMPFSFAALLDRPDIWRGDSLSRAGTPTVPCGFPGLDAELPGGGWPAGALTEILPAHEGIGELRLLGPALAGLSKRGLRLVWATEQALASNACGAVLAWPQGAKYAELRRLQIAAEGGRAPAFLFRVPEAASESSPAPLRIALGTSDGGLAVRVLKRRGAPLARPILLPPMPPTVRSKNHHVDRHSAAPAAARDFSARLVHA